MQASRFFPDKSAADKNGNALPGTLVDREVTHPFQYDFYLCAHVALQGTARPVHYHVIHDEVGMKPDDLQKMIPLRPPSLLYDQRLENLRSSREQRNHKQPHETKRPHRNPRRTSTVGSSLRLARLRVTRELKGIRRVVEAPSHVHGLALDASLQLEEPPPIVGLRPILDPRRLASVPAVGSGRSGRRLLKGDGDRNGVVEGAAAASAEDGGDVRTQFACLVGTVTGGMGGVAGVGVCPLDEGAARVVALGS